MCLTMNINLFMLFQNSALVEFQAQPGIHTLLLFQRLLNQEAVVMPTCPDVNLPELAEDFYH